MDKFLHFEDCYIERVKDSLSGEVAKLRDEEGTCVFQFPATWTDEQIKQALEFANEAYAQGIEIGKMRKVAEIRAALALG